MPKEFKYKPFGLCDNEVKRANKTIRKYEGVTEAFIKAKEALMREDANMVPDEEGFLISPWKRTKDK